jgi:beta-glucanase (GH16 family)
MKIKQNWVYKQVLIFPVVCLLMISGCSLLEEDTGDYTLAWSDEFNDYSLDESVWNYDTGNGTNGWGNNELEYYTSDEANIRVEDFEINGESGTGLVIEALEESYGSYDYTSAKITTKDNFDFTYGKVEARIQLPVDEGNSTGIWPAFWMLGSNIDEEGWPECGEIDIMELVGDEPDTIYCNLHYDYDGDHVWTGDWSDENMYTLDSGDFGDEFHTFGIEWEEGEVSWLLDDEVYYTQTSWCSSLDGENAPFDRDFYIILNLAVGGDWPGSPDSDTTFPKTMTVDYVRVYQKD